MESKLTKISVIVCVVILASATLITQEKLTHESSYAYACNVHTLTTTLAKLTKPELTMCISYLKTGSMSTKDITDIIFGRYANDAAARAGGMLRARFKDVVKDIELLGYDKVAAEIEQIRSSSLSTKDLVKNIKNS